ncbi:MAG: hypothetical protein NT004_17175 [Bacteroidetes bacterium]|nr:hypothetical protein [Bacteroidota bacterium]
MQGLVEYSLVFAMIGGFLRFIVLFGGAFFLLWYYLKKTRKEVPVISHPAENNVLVPLRLQAYERFVMFLERIHPSNLVMRLNNPDLTALQLQSLVVRAIMEEFDYNLSQQLYISNSLWELIKNSKEETIALINQASSQLPEGSMSGDLVKNVFSIAISKSKLPTEEALDEIKHELRRNFS